MRRTLSQVFVGMQSLQCDLLTPDEPYLALGMLERHGLVRTAIDLCDRLVPDAAFRRGTHEIGVVFAKMDVGVAVQLDESALEMVPLYTSVVEFGVFVNAASVAGRTTAAPLVAGEPVRASSLTDRGSQDLR